MREQLSGIHHVTAIASDPQANVDFYVGVLGLRLVKRTVNFDDPGTYHLYYGDRAGSPGTIMTFFPWPASPRGKVGTGQVGATAFSIPKDGVAYWQDRLARHNVVVQDSVVRFEERVLPFEDPDGLPLELIAAEHDPRPGWPDGPVAPLHAIRGFHSVTLLERSGDACEPTTSLLTSMDFPLLHKDGDRFRYAAGADADRAPHAGAPGTLVDVLCRGGLPPGRIAAGTVHHVAWRTLDDAQQLAWRRRIAEMGIGVTDVRDRQYFRSIYFREPGGVLFEIATDPPGFTADESLERLGTELKLPPWLESRRGALERSLPAIRLPELVRDS
ncbi:MAG TPA: ring-cleaving dioxygenase [bacterium]|nr:ring-cleaving dioxygenase [bacterium]